MSVKTPERNAWHLMKYRCYDKKCESYSLYGGRGITVSPLWLNDFRAFLAHVGPRPSRLHSIDRIDGNKGYEPGNVRWATQAEQHRNMRTNRFVYFNGERMIFNDACVLAGIPDGVARERIRRGWSTTDALMTPVLKKKVRINKHTCGNGHEISGGNVLVAKNGRLDCRTCANETYRRYRASKKLRNMAQIMAEHAR